MAGTENGNEGYVGTTLIQEKGMPVTRKKVGLIVNPIAGMGGKVGLKGTDGAGILKRAIELGARPESPKRTMDALEVLVPIKDHVEFLTYPLDMGENQARAIGFDPVVMGDLTDKDEVGDSDVGDIGRQDEETVPNTTFQDTENAARDMLRAGVDLILFAGGDGTARNIYNAIGDKIPVLGIPAGVKIHSPVYATNPRSAGRLAAKFIKGEVTGVREAEVMDIDEDAFREGRVTPRLYGYLRVPYEERLMQNMKSGSVESEAAALDGIADRIIEEMEPDVVYIIGPGTTTRLIMEKMGLKATLLGVDAVSNGRLLVADASEKDLLHLLNQKREIGVKAEDTPGEFSGTGSGETGEIATGTPVGNVEGRGGEIYPGVPPTSTLTGGESGRTGQTMGVTDLLLTGAGRAQIIVTIIGGQGYVFGRGNQQISPEIIRKVGTDNIRIIATRGKLDALNRRPLLVDTGDDDLNQALSGYVRVLVSYDREVMYRIG